MFLIYCVTCKLNDKKYYGQTVKTLEERWKGHLRTARRDSHFYHLHRAIRKYGEYNFKIELIEIVTTKEAANEREKYYIDKDDTFKSGYNMTKGGEGSVGRRDSEETKVKRNASMRETLKDGFSEEHREKLSIARKKHSGPNKGKKFSEEHKRKLSLARIGNTNRLGKKLNSHVLN